LGLGATFWDLGIGMQHVFFNPFYHLPWVEVACVAFLWLLLKYAAVVSIDRKMALHWMELAFTTTELALSTFALSHADSIDLIQSHQNAEHVEAAIVNYLAFAAVDITWMHEGTVTVKQKVNALLRGICKYAAGLSVCVFHTVIHQGHSLVALYFLLVYVCELLLHIHRVLRLNRERMKVWGFTNQVIHMAAFVSTRSVAPPLVVFLLRDQFHGFDEASVSPKRCVMVSPFALLEFLTSCLLFV
jgi:hypothetical protein